MVENGNDRKCYFLENDRRSKSDRREDWGPLHQYVKWSLFMWIIGGIVTAASIIYSFLWNQAENNYNNIWESVKEIQLHLDSATQEIGVINSELDHSSKIRDFYVDSFRREVDRIQPKLASMDEQIKLILVKLGRMEEMDGRNKKQ